jgi:hypothetical protein
MQVFSDHPVMAPEEYCSIYSADNYTQQVSVIYFFIRKVQKHIASWILSKKKTRLHA